MTKDELILKGKHKVRNDSNLMSFYIDLFYQQFGHKPVCAGCSFSRDWERFTRTSSEKVLSTKHPVQDKTFRLKRAGSDIFLYRRDGKPFRCYGNKMTEHYAVEYLTYGTPEEIEGRKKLFSILPEALR